MQKLIFADNPIDYNKTELEYVVYISKNLSDRDSLLKNISNKLNFPDYYGNNWDALYDCLCDFHWINQNGVVIIHEDLPQLEKSELKIYIETLCEAANSWKIGEEHYLKIIFPKNTIEFISKLL